MTAPADDFAVIDAMEGGPISYPTEPDSPPQSSGGREIWCETGQHNFVKTGRGRDPKNCPEHRARRADAAPRTSRAAVNIEAAITANVAGIAQIVAMFNQYDGACIANGAPFLGASVADVAARDPKVRKALERAMASMGWGQVVAAVGMIVVPILVNHGIMPNPNRHQDIPRTGQGLA